MALAGVATLAPTALILAIALLLDLVIGDPVTAWHPVRLMGRTLTAVEAALRRLGLDGYGGGIALFLILSAVWVVGVSALVRVLGGWHYAAGWVLQLFVVYTLLALGDLLRHVWRIERALRVGDLPRAREAVGALVGRDTDRLDAAACRRAAVESLSENLTDGVVSPICWYVVGGLPGLVLFKVVSTMDSMVGYKTPRYVRFGWCGARLDDLMNYVPARLTWILITIIAVILPRYAGRKAWRIGLTQHGLLLGPNAGWSEAAAAGALQRRLVGPIWRNGIEVTDLWLGDPTDPPLGAPRDTARACVLVALTGILAGVLGVLLLIG